MREKSTGPRYRAWLVFNVLKINRLITVAHFVFAKIKFFVKLEKHTNNKNVRPKSKYFAEKFL